MMMSNEVIVKRNSRNKLSIRLCRLIFKYVTSVTIALVLFLCYYTISISVLNHHPIFVQPTFNVPLLKTWGAANGGGDPIDIEFEHDDNSEMLNTPGCFIPGTVIKYKKKKKNVNTKSVCGRRAVFLKKTAIEGNIITTIFYKNVLKKLANGLPYICCYHFGHGINFTYGKSRTSCNPLYHGKEFILDSDFVSVQCHTENFTEASTLIYEDFYLFAKKLQQNSIRGNCEHKHNVLMIGVHSMSLKKSLSAIPLAVEYMEENYFFTFRGYNKVEDFAGMILAALTGEDFASVDLKCSKQMDNCNDMMLWSLFKKAGYVTAYGEEGLRLRRNFNGNYIFHHPPTDHYTEPFFSTNERYSNNSPVCTGKVPSTQQLLDYALDFATTYSQDGFFGLFWINSNGFDEDSTSSSYLDEALENLLSRAGDNTLVVVFGDQGARAGRHRLSVHGFYDERLPALYLRLPQSFGLANPKSFANLFRNQYRLTSPYDLHRTLVNVLEACTTAPPVHGGSFRGISLFNNISRHRTCIDASIGTKWCSCYDMKMVILEKDPEANKALTLVKKSFDTMLIATKPGWTCAPVTFKQTLSAFTSHGKIPTASSYVLAFQTSSGNKTYEATVVTGDTFRIDGPISQISTYQGEGHCVLNDDEKYFCKCTKVL